MKDKTPEEIVEAIPQEKRGHVFHLLGNALGHKESAAVISHMPPAVSADDSGGNGPGPK